MIIQGNCKEKLKEIKNNSVDSIVTDPPYELGFMGKIWDNTGISNDKEMWAECLRVLKPGGHLLAFSGTRTYHRMASAIEGAGFEVRDMIEWVYGSGFPKSLNIGKAVDKLQGNERIELGDNPNTRKSHKEHVYELGLKSEAKYTKGTSEWEGWGTALKPAHEPICMARKPLAEKTVAENCLKWGTGGINIDESRVGNERRTYSGGNKLMEDRPWNETQHEKPQFTVNGRFPANLIHDNSEEVRECFPDVKGSKGSGLTKTTARSWKNTSIAGINRVGYEDNGNASRFFKSIIYQAKASKSERNKWSEELPIKSAGGLRGRADGSLGREPVTAYNNHPTVKPIALMEYLINIVTPKGGKVLDPFMGSGSTGVAAKKNGYDFIGIEIEEDYIKIANARMNESSI